MKNDLLFVKPSADTSLQIVSPSQDNTTMTTCNNESNKTFKEKEVALFGRLVEENAKLPPQDSTAFILAQIERQNVLLERDPKSIYIQSNELKAHFTTVQRLVKANVRHEEEEIDWGFWEAFIEDSDQVALRLPHLLSLKLRLGIPNRVRGLMWQAMSKSASMHLETVYEQLCKEKSPHERIIQRDLARTYPRIDMFKQENGQGQNSMKRILEAYSLYDTDVGYCQGLAFLVGPLLMNMPETQSFCVFVRLMETYDMRTMFTLNMEGLQLRLYQFSSLFHEILPELAAYLDKHGVHPAMYASQWFLTLFAYAFPMPLIDRIFDIVFAEGASETIMRVSIAMLKRSQATLMQDVTAEFENILDFVTCRKLCDPYSDNYGHVIRDAMALSGVITREKMERLNEEYRCKERHDEDVAVLAASRLGFWKRRKSSMLGKKTSRLMTRSASIDAATKDPENTALLQNKRWSSFSSPSQEWSAAASDKHHSNQQSRELKLALKELEELKESHQQTLHELILAEHDKQDLVCERDALKMTIAELEKFRQKDEERRKQENSSMMAYDCDSPIMLPSRSSYYNISSSCKNSIHTSLSSAEVEPVPLTPTNDRIDHDLSSKVVHIKVKNFELEQQCEKLVQDLEMLQSKFDMVNEGQMALIERLLSLKTEMDELVDEKKEQEEAWLCTKEENERLKFEMKMLKNSQGNRRKELRRHSTSSLYQKETRSLSEFDTTTTISSKLIVDLIEKKKRASSLYGRIFHVFSKS
ncbi:MAG: rab-GTPase-TBC domain-containing protein [Benjaminiella poitrasii]|nr:MAG: rab-GTPase-TBC domain-containing protein [Benjaminiella poitrasii]